MHALAVLQQPPLCGKRAEESWQRKSGEDLGQSQPSPTFLSAVSASEFSAGEMFCNSFGSGEPAGPGDCRERSDGRTETGDRDESLGRGWRDGEQRERKG